MRILVILALLLSVSPSIHAADPIGTPAYFNRVVEAIGKAENSTRYPYGIKSIETHGDIAYARQICLNTVRNNWKRYLAVDKTPTEDEYLVFLAKRYCPIGAPDDPTNLNRHWIKNVRYFMGLV